jgi:hypothetical protein
MEGGKAMNSRRWLVLILALVLVATVGGLYALPRLARAVLISQVHAITHRPVRVDGVDVHPLQGRFVVRGFHLDERNGAEPFADFERLDLRINLPSLLRGHLWIRDLVLRNSTVRVVRFPKDFNFSDLIQSSGTSGRTLDVTVDRFALVGGTVTFEDRALAKPRTWKSEDIQIEAHNLSTRRNDGRAVGHSMTAGAPVSVEISNLRLVPIALQGTVTVTGLDLSLARLYFPPGAPVILDRGRASSTVKVSLDARAGVRADVTGQIEDLALVRPGGGEALALVPKMTTQVTNFTYQDGRLALGRFELDGTASVLDQSAGSGRRFEIRSLRASVADLTWPVTTPGRLDVSTSFSGGNLTVTGSLQAPPAPSQLRLRLANLDLAPWTRFLPVSARINGVAEADLRTDEPLAPDVPTRIGGMIAVKRVGVAADRQQLLGAQRVEASGLEVHWPSRVRVKRLLVNEPRVKIERDRTGGFPLLTLWRPEAQAPAAAPAAATAKTTTAPPTTSSVAVDVEQIAVRGGAVSWHDDAVRPPAALDFSQIDATVTGAAWPLNGPAGVRVLLHSPSGGSLQLAGRVGIDPPSADVRVSAKDVELAPYQVYAATPARVNGRAELDVAVKYPASSEATATVRGNAALARVDVRDGQRTVMRAERIAANGLAVQWPERINVKQLALQRPWVLLERDEQGAMPLRALLPAPAPPAGPAAASEPNAAPTDAAPSPDTAQSSNTTVVTVGEVVMDDGGARVVDRSVSPPFAVDLDRLALQLDGLSTASAKPSRLELTGRAGRGSDLAVRGTIRPVGGPLLLDVNAELRGFAIPRANSYLLRYVAWEARDGWLYSTVRCRVDGDKLDAKTDIHLSRLQVARAGPQDKTAAQIGVPLGMVVSLMKDSRGAINVSLPVGGRLGDPRFDFTEAIWHAVRTVAVKAITAPVSWIGRVHVSGDSHIDRIEIDPIRFRPGTATLAPDGQEQAARLVAFLKQVPDARMSLTSVVSSRDVAALQQQKLKADVERTARESGTSPEAAAARLFERRFERRPLPDSPDAVLAALAEGEATTDEASALSTQRLQTVQEMVKQAGIDPARLSQRPAVDGREAPPGQAPDSEVKLDLVETDSPARQGPEFQNFLKKLLSAPPVTDRARG